MTIGSIQPVEKKGRGRKNKQVVDETTPLLSSRHDEANFHELNGAGFSGAVFNLSITIIGAGIMALSASMKMFGLIPGIAMIIFVAFLTESSIKMLLRFSKAGKIFTYGGVIGDAFGKIGSVLLQISVVVNTIGVMIVYMIIIGFSLTVFEVDVDNFEVDVDSFDGALVES